jgi:sterol desaturase/sphingolipid hydroxylase (fatty acid hydroxylase superfamily)
MLDLLYPVFSSSVRVLVVLLAYNPISQFYETHLSFLHTRVLEGVPLFWQGFGAFLVLDFGHWLSHWIRHKVRWLWYFHAVHHSQTEMSPWTAWRAHPLEEVWNWALILIPAGLFGGDRSMWIVVTVLYGTIWPPFTHSNLRTNLGLFKYLIVSPQYHRVHHSNDPRQYDCNFGENLLIWDWMFGTMWKDMNSYPDTGIPNGEFIEERSATPAGLVGAWARQCVYPFMMIGRSVRSALRTARDKARGP